MLTKDMKKYASRYLVLSIVVITHILIVVLMFEFFFMERQATVGNLERKRCENTFSFFADHGRFEFLLKADHRYDWKSVPKSLCNGFIEGVQTKLVGGGAITGTIYLAEQDNNMRDSNWRLFGPLEFALFIASFFFYWPRVTRNAFGLSMCFLFCYVAYRWFVAIL